MTPTHCDKAVNGKPARDPDIQPFAHNERTTCRKAIPGPERGGRDTREDRPKGATPDQPIRTCSRDRRTILASGWAIHPSVAPPDGYPATGRGGREPAGPAPLRTVAPGTGASNGLRGTGRLRKQPGCVDRRGCATDAGTPRPGGNAVDVRARGWPMRSARRWSRFVSRPCPGASCPERRRGTRGRRRGTFAVRRLGQVRPA